MNKNFYINSYAVWKGSDEKNLPDVSFIPPLIRRRLTDVEKIGLFLANQVCGERDDYFVVFSSRFGEWGQTIKLIRQFSEDREMSPSWFSTSVHNAMPGILSVLKHNKMVYTAVAGNDKTLDNALVEAFCGNKPVLFVYAEEKMPDIYSDVCSESINWGYGCAFLISDENIGQCVNVESKISNVKVPFENLVDFLLGNSDVLNTLYLTLRKK